MHHHQLGFTDHNYKFIPQIIHTTLLDIKVNKHEAKTIQQQLFVDQRSRTYWRSLKWHCYLKC